MKLKNITFIMNIVVLTCFTILAIVFHKWWVILFALLFMTSVETKHKFYRICDSCGKHSPKADSYNQALDAAKEAGWEHIVDGNKDYCPDCKNKHKE